MALSNQEREEIKAMMHEAMDEYFINKGRTGKSMLLTTAIIIGALTVILGSIKSLLAWIGFHYVTK